MKKAKLCLYLIFAFYTDYSFASLRILYDCEEHENRIVTTPVETSPRMHHRVRLNDYTFIKEIENQQWFIEDISCMQNGFTLKVMKFGTSPTLRSLFEITVITPNTYNITIASN